MMLLILQNLILFQAGWLVCVLGGAHAEYAWVGVAAVVFIVALHLVRAERMYPETILILVTMLIGIAWDSILTFNGLFEFSNGIIASWLAPYWIFAMWALFATTLNVSLRWMKGNYMLAAVFGAVGGPVAYYAGHRLGAVEFADTGTTMALVSVGWAMIMPALMALSERFNGYAADHSATEVNRL